ncbi:hypothetical protein G6K93_07530 [Agrobacterium rhizogenes]|nr:hypothetical protein [Rhizobium rhizogenes]
MELLFQFDELAIVLNGKTETGMLIGGTAELVDAGADYPGEFYVRSVMLDGGTMLHRNRTVDAFEAELFKRIEAVICNDKSVIGRHAALEWSDACSEAVAA